VKEKKDAEPKKEKEEVKEEKEEVKEKTKDVKELEMEGEMMEENELESEDEDGDEKKEETLALFHLDILDDAVAGKELLTSAIGCVNELIDKQVCVWTEDINKLITAIDSACPVKNIASVQDQLRVDKELADQLITNKLYPLLGARCAAMDICVQAFKGIDESVDRRLFPPSLLQKAENATTLGKVTLASTFVVFHLKVHIETLPDDAKLKMVALDQMTSELEGKKLPLSDALKSWVADVKDSLIETTAQ
jgi:hypothetical protein